MDARVMEYLDKPYNTIVKKIKDGDDEYYYGQILELDGCQSTGDTMDELNENLRVAMEGYIETKLAHDLPIPEPRDSGNYSGKILVRLPKSLHHRLALEADRDSVSLNTLIVQKLSC